MTSVKILLIYLTRDYDEVILVFDTYKAGSLKCATRDKRRQGKDQIQYQIRDDTSINHIPMSRFRTHDKTKADLTEYLAAIRTLEYNKNSSKVVINEANMGSSRSRKSKGLADLICLFGGRQHWEVPSYWQCYQAASLPQSRWRRGQGFADAFECHCNH